VKSKISKLINRIALALVVVLFFGTLLSDTFAWREYSQFKTNSAIGGTLRYDVTLNDTFVPVNDWVVGDRPIHKAVTVTNPTQSGEPVYVRIVLKEYLQLNAVSHVYSGSMYATDPVSGRFYAVSDGSRWTVDFDEPLPFAKNGVRYTEAEFRGAMAAISPAAVSSWIASLGFDPANTLTEIAWDVATGDAGLFIVDWLDGRRAVTAVAQSVRSVPEFYLGNTVARSSYAEMETGKYGVPFYYDPAELYGEQLYPPHNYAETVLDPTYPIREYVAWHWDTAKVISIGAFLANPSRYAGGVWVYTDTDPYYLYWSNPLGSGETTGDALGTVELVSQPDSAFYYAIHVDLEAVSKDELSAWLGFTGRDATLNAPAALIDLWLSGA
jgi:hypothetical protein